MCSYNNNRGLTACSNNHRVRIDVLEGAVLTAIERSVLMPAAVEYVVEKALQLVRESQEQQPDLKDRLEADYQRLHRQLENLVSAIAQGQNSTMIMAEIQRREFELKTLKTKRRNLISPQDFTMRNWGELRRGAHARMGQFNDLLHSDVPMARKALRELLNGNIRCIPVIKDGRKS